MARLQQNRTVVAPSRLLDPSVDPEFDRWTASLRRNTGASVAAFCLFDGPTVLVKSVSTAVGSPARVTELAGSGSFESYIRGVAGAIAPTDACCSYADALVAVEGQVIGRISMADQGRIGWTQDDLAALDDTAVALSNGVALRLARQEAKRVHQLVASHNQVEDLIAQAAPLRDVLMEAMKSIERHDPSLKPCVLMLDPVSNTLHSGIGPSLSPEYLSAVDGVVIGPNIGTCGAAAWSGQLTITANIAEDPKWAPVRELASGAGLSRNPALGPVRQPSRPLIRA